MIPIAEIFGPTIQGEGAVIGQKTIFIRVAGCDYRCSWCDSAFAQVKDEEWTVDDVCSKVIELANASGKQICSHITLSGGNPLLVGDEMGKVIKRLKEEGFSFGVETQGTVYQNWLKEIDDIVISPKGPSSRMPFHASQLDKMIEEIKDLNWSLKIVVFDEEDLLFAKKVFARYPYAKKYLSLGNPYYQEEGNITDKLLRDLERLWDRIIVDADFNDVRCLPQLHALVWSNLQGV